MNESEIVLTGSRLTSESNHSSPWMGILCYLIVVEKIFKHTATLSVTQEVDFSQDFLDRNDQ